MILEVPEDMKEFIESIDAKKTQENIMDIEIKLSDKLPEDHKAILGGCIVKSIVDNVQDLSTNGINIKIK